MRSSMCSPLCETSSRWRDDSVCGCRALPDTEPCWAVTGADEEVLHQWVHWASNWPATQVASCRTKPSSRGPRQCAVRAARRTPVGDRRCVPGGAPSCLPSQRSRQAPTRPSAGARKGGRSDTRSARCTSVGSRDRATSGRTPLRCSELRPRPDSASPATRIPAATPRASSRLFPVELLPTSRSGCKTVATVVSAAMTFQRPSATLNPM